MKRTKRIIVTLSVEELAAIKQAATREISSVSAYVRKAAVEAARKGEGK